MSITGLVTLLSVAVAFLITPVYRAEVLMVPVTSESVDKLSNLAGQFGGLTSLMGIDLVGQRGKATEAVATLTSRSFAVQFIDEENLLPILFADQWDNENEQWQIKDPDDIPTLQDGFRLFDDIRVVSAETPSLITLSIDWVDRELAPSWANLMVQRVNHLLRQRAIEHSENSLNYLNSELEKTKIVELHQAIYRLIEKSINEIMLANVTDEFAFRVVDPAAVLEEEDRIWPKRKLIVAIGFLIGGALGFSVAFMRNFNQSQVLKAE